MSYTPVRDEVAIASAAIALLERDVMLAGTVWRDPVRDFSGKKNDTVSIRLPAYAVANRRTLRANDARVRSALKARKVDVTLDNDLQIDVPLTDENLTLDVEGLVKDVVAPSIGAIVRGYDEAIAEVMDGGDYEVIVDWDDSAPYESLVDADTALNDASVPATDRFLVVGSALYAQLRKDELLVQANTSGSTQTLRRGVVGEVANFEVMTSPFIAPTVGFAYHRTAYALASRAPAVPQGVAWGNVQSSNGLAIRVMQHLAQDDDGDLLNLVYHDSWFGASTVTDNGTFNVDGKFVPATDPSNPSNDRLVRAVKLTAGS